MNEIEKRAAVDDELLDRVLIGGRQPTRIVIVDYDPAWPVRYEQERVRIERALRGRALRIEHVGSTSVPGLAAKPIIDILVTLDDVEQDDALISDFEAAGYPLRVHEPGHRMFRTPERDVHIHVFDDGASDVAHQLLLRERLRRSESDRALYAATKRELAEREWSDMNYYADAKSNVIREILIRATEDQPQRRR
ncbi:MAG TPA: GrpB family protein [Nitrolancea sp.]|nr:GrpB family protein [Nitrolancea sp.]